MNILKRKKEEVITPPVKKEEDRVENMMIQPEEADNQEETDDTPIEIVEYNNKEEESAVEEESTEEDNNGITEGFLREAEAFATGKGLNEAEFKEAIDGLKGIRDKNAVVDIAMLEKVIKAINYDRDVAAAYNKGEIAGRNTKIEQLYMQPKKTDGLPHPKGNNSSRSRRATSIFDLARSAL